MSEPTEIANERTGRDVKKGKQNLHFRVPQSLVKVSDSLRIKQILSSV